jgi:hypothetical protein
VVSSLNEVLVCVCVCVCASFRFVGVCRFGCVLLLMDIVFFRRVLDGGEFSVFVRYRSN